MIVGIDPGGRSTGIVVRSGRRCVYAAVVIRNSDGLFPSASYLDEVLETVRVAIGHAGASPVIAVEGVVNPSPHMGLSNPGGIIAAAMVLGAVLAHWPDAVVVRPGGHGSGDLASYPKVLVGPREKSGGGRMRHARSAWDIAGAARMAQ